MGCVASRRCVASCGYLYRWMCTPVGAGAGRLLPLPLHLAPVTSTFLQADTQSSTLSCSMVRIFKVIVLLIENEIRWGEIG